VGVILALGATLGARTATSQEAIDKDAATLTIYRSVTVIDGSGSAPRPGMAILVRDERIESVLADAQTKVPPEAKVIALPGRSVVPGLVNAHVHLATPPDRRYFAALLRRDLYGGVTAVRAMGDDVRAVAELAREALLFELPAPDIDYAAFDVARLPHRLPGAGHAIGLSRAGFDRRGAVSRWRTRGRALGVRAHA
jgi:imidazolonepropionase-like amidohydrolase